MTVRTRESKSSRASGQPVKRGGWQKHFEGWQPGLLAVFLAAMVAILVVPREIPPSELPLPEPDGRTLAAVIATDAALAGVAARDEDPDVLRLDVALRKLGRASFRGDRAAMQAERDRVDVYVRKAIQAAPDAVKALRALHLSQFLFAVRALEATGEATDDLQALGGSFLEKAAASGWWMPSERSLVIDDRALRAWFKKQWNEVTGLKGPAFAVTADEDRSLFCFLLREPPRSAGGGASGAIASADNYRLRKVRELGAWDATYPTAFAEGVLLFRLGQYEAAAGAFERFLEANPSGPWTLRATHHLKAALALAM